MKKTKIWMLITGCLNLIEVILNTDVLLNRNGCLAKMVSDLADSKIWVDIEWYCQELCAKTTASLMKLVQRRPNSGATVVRQGWRSHLRSP